MLTPKSTQKKSRKKNKVSPTKTPARELDENVLFDEFEEEISQEAKTYIDIATDKTVIDSLSKAGYLSYLRIGDYFHLKMPMVLRKNKNWASVSLFTC